MMQPRQIQHRQIQNRQVLQRKMLAEQGGRNAALALSRSVFLVIAAGGALIASAFGNTPGGHGLDAGAGAGIEGPDMGAAVAAVVDDVPITTFDVSQRISLIALTSGGRIPQSALPQLQQQVLGELIDERLKLNEAERVEFEVPGDEVEEEVTQLAARNRMTVPQLAQMLGQAGIAIESLEEQVRANLVWQRLVRAKFGRRVNVTDDEVNNFIDQIKEETSKQQFLVSELCLPVEDLDRVEEIRRAGIQIINEMRKGVPFEALARQFSACASAGASGNLGWVAPGELDPAIDAIITELQPGTVSVPTYHDGMVRILALRSKRDATVAGEHSFRLGYISAPAHLGRATVDRQFARLAETNVCNGDENLVDMGADFHISRLPLVKLSGVNPAYSETLQSIREGEMTSTIEIDGFYHAALLCEKDEGLGLPTRAAVKDKLFGDELSLLSRKYLRDVKRDSAVEVLLGKDDAS